MCGLSRRVRALPSVVCLLSICSITPMSAVVADEGGLDAKAVDLLLEEIRSLRREVAEVKTRLERLETKIGELAATKTSPRSTSLEPLERPRAGEDPDSADDELARLARKGSARSSEARTLLDRLLEGKVKHLVLEDEFESRPPDEEKLAAIELPDEPDEDDVRRYIGEIRQATRGQNMFSPDDPQVRMLVRLGHEWLPQLVKASTESFGGSGHLNPTYHFNRAIERLATEDDQELILGALLANRDLVDTVALRGWEEDCRDTLVSVLQTHPPYLPEKWIEAVARLEDPATYDALLWYFVHGGSSPESTYRAIRALPEIELDRAVAQLWQNARDELPVSGLSWRERTVARIALAHGHADAIETLLDVVDDPGASSYERQEVLRTLRRHTSVRNVSDLREWYQTHRDKLEFDPTSRKFRPARSEAENDRGGRTGER